VRNYTLKPSGLSFTIHAVRMTHLTTQEFASGNLLLKIDGKDSGRIVVQDGKAGFSLPAGEHEVELQK
jgi:hypothetical protein